MMDGIGISLKDIISFIGRSTTSESFQQLQYVSPEWMQLSRVLSRSPRLSGALGSERAATAVYSTRLKRANIVDRG